MTDAQWTYSFLCISAFLAGVINSVAGGGTLLTFPALAAALAAMDYGDDAEAFANATSTLALLPGSLAGTWGYRNELREVKGFAFRMLPVSFVGGVIGSWLLVKYPGVFKSLVPWLVLTAAVLFIVQPALGKVIRRHQTDTHEPGWGTFIGLQLFQFLVAIYGGYFGAGIGILMLTALGFMGIGNIHRMNATKTLLAATINAVSVVIFVWQGFIYWPYAGAMAAAAIVGGYAGARVARRLPAIVVRWVVIVIGLGLSGYYFVNG